MHKQTTNLLLLLGSLLLWNCQNPGIKPPDLSVLPQAMQEGWNVQRWYWSNVALDTPLVQYREKNINGLATSALFRVWDRLILTTRNGFLISTDTLLKDVDRKRFSRGISAAPAFWHALAFIPSEKGNYGLQAYDLIHKKIIWRLKGHLTKSSPLIQGRLLIHASLKGNILALDPLSGKQIWQYQFPQNIRQNLAMTDRLIAVCSADGMLGVFDADSGQPLFMLDLPGHVYTAPMILRNAIYLADLKGQIIKVDLHDGQIIKRIDLNTPFYQPFSTDGRKLFIMGSDGRLFAFSENLEQMQSVPLKGVPSMPIVVTRRYVLVGTYQKIFYMVEKAKLRVVQQISLKRRPVACTPDRNATLFLATEYDRLQLFRTEEKHKP